jgi:alcohol dehydrogenase class IV
MSTNVRALRQRAPDSEALPRYDEVARRLTGRAPATADDGIQWVGQLVSDLKVPRLGTYGIQSEHVAELVKKAMQASSMKANPVVLTPEELAGTLRQAL